MYWDYRARGKRHEKRTTKLVTWQDTVQDLKNAWPSSTGGTTPFFPLRGNSGKQARVNFP